MNSVSDEIELLDGLIRASEDWSKQYQKDPKTHEQLIKSESRLDRALRKYFRGMAENANQFVNWSAYRAQVNAAADIDSIVSDDNINSYANGLMKVMFDPILASTFAGTAAGESIYSVPLGIQSTDAIMQQLTTEHVAGLVGKIIDKKTGLIIDNPKKGYSILETLRNDILATVKSSIGLGLDQDEATSRITDLIGNPSRAGVISRTETVNAYSSGLQEFGKQSGAAGKEWQDVGAQDVCSDYADLGPVEFDYDYDGSGLMGPVAHPNCRCGLRLIYQKEWDDLNK